MALEMFDHDTQDLILIEEMSELTKELLKRRRGKDNDAGLIEEMAHALISISVVQNLYGISDEDLYKEAVKKLKKYGYAGHRAPKLPGDPNYVIDETPIEEPTEMWPKENPYLKKETLNENH